MVYRWNDKKLLGGKVHCKSFLTDINIYTCIKKMLILQ